MREIGGQWFEGDMNSTGNQVDRERGRPTIWDMKQIYPCHRLEQFSSQVSQSTDRRRAHIQRTWIRLGVRDEFRDRPGGHRWVYGHGQGQLHKAGDGRNISQ